MIDNLPQIYDDESLNADIGTPKLRSGVPQRDFADLYHIAGGPTSLHPMRQAPQVFDPVTPLLKKVLKGIK